MAGLEFPGGSEIDQCRLTASHLDGQGVEIHMLQEEWIRFHDAGGFVSKPKKKTGPAEGTCINLNN
jgi:hypothetical protein